MQYGHAVQHMAGIVDDDTSGHRQPSSRRTASRGRTSAGSPKASHHGSRPSTGDGSQPRPRRRDHPPRPHPRAAGHRDARGRPRHRAGPGQRLPDGIRRRRLGVRAKIDLDEIEERRGDLPMALPLDRHRRRAERRGSHRRGHASDTPDGGPRRGVQAERRTQTVLRHTSHVWASSPVRSSLIVPTPTPISVDLPAFQKLVRPTTSPRLRSAAGRQQQRVSRIDDRFGTPSPPGTKNGDPLDTPVARRCGRRPDGDRAAPCSGCVRRAPAARA